MNRQQCGPAFALADRRYKKYYCGIHFALPLVLHPLSKLLLLCLFILLASCQISLLEEQYARDSNVTPGEKRGKSSFFDFKDNRFIFFFKSIISIIIEIALFFSVYCSVEGINGNKTYSFLITLDTDIGELIMIKFKWEGTAVWENIWDTVQTIIPWRKGTRRPGLIVKTIRVKAGETQQK